MRSLETDICRSYSCVRSTTSSECRISCKRHRYQRRDASAGLSTGVLDGLPGPGRTSGRVSAMPRIVEIAAHAIRLCGKDPIWEAVGQQLFDTGGANRTETHGEDECWAEWPH
jgi:hypothetical protein